MPGSASTNSFGTSLVASQSASGLMAVQLESGGTVFWGIVAFAGIEEALRRGRQGETSPILDVPVAPFRWLMVAAIVLMIMVLLLRAAQEVSGTEAKE